MGMAGMDEAILLRLRYSVLETNGNFGWSGQEKRWRMGRKRFLGTRYC